jgi:hypothetical protein
MGQEQQEQGHWGNSNRTVLQQHWGRGHRTVIAMGQCRSIVFRLCCNGEGATETPAINESIAMAPGQGHWGTGARATEQCCNRQNSVAMAMGQRSIDRLIVFYIAAQNVDNSGW